MCDVPVFLGLVFGFKDGHAAVGGRDEGSGVTLSVDGPGRGFQPTGKE